MAGAHDVVVSARGAREARRLPKETRAAVLAALRALGQDPRLGKPLTCDLAGLRALRRGDHRILYRVDDRLRRAEVARIAHRRDVYRRRL